MKRNLIVILLIFVIILLILSVIFILQLTNMQDVKKVYDEDIEFFNKYQDVQFDITDFISIMNKAIENNNKHEIQQNEEKEYIEDDKYSIKIYLRLDDREELIPMEVLMLSDSGGSKVISELFADIVYRYDSIEYHELTGRVKKIVIYGFTKTDEAEFKPYD